jgi:hypothetical protein
VAGKRKKNSIEVFAGGIIKYAAKRATPAALVVLRALSAVAPEPYGATARREADRLAAAGVAERRWAGAVGRVGPTEAWLSYDPVDDDGVSVVIGFDGAGGADTVAVYLDHNLGGLAKDAFAVPAGVEEVLGQLQEKEVAAGPESRPISLGEASARWRAALEMTDRTMDPPTTEDLDHLRALVLARLATVPSDGEVPATREVPGDERDKLLTDFLESDETNGLLGLDGEDNEDEAVELLSHQVMTFSLDYVLGTPLRFSSVMVELFCLDWAPRKIAARRGRLHPLTRRGGGMDPLRGSAEGHPRGFDLGGGRGGLRLRA